MVLKETRVSSETIFTGHVFTVNLDQAEIGDGTIRDREVILHPGGVSVVILTDDDKVLMVRQFRYAPAEVLLELPAGKLEPGEDPFAAVKREQKEETGTTSDEYVYLGEVYPTPAYDTEVIRIWGCRVSTWGKQHLDDGELLEVEQIPIFDVEKMVLNNELPDAKTQIGILKAASLVRAGKL